VYAAGPWQGYCTTEMQIGMRFYYVCVTNYLVLCMAWKFSNGLNVGLPSDENSVV